MRNKETRAYLSLAEFTLQAFDLFRLLTCIDWVLKIEDEQRSDDAADKDIENESQRLLAHAGGCAGSEGVDVVLWHIHTMKACSVIDSNRI